MSKYSILVVEDELVVANDIKITLTNLGYDVIAIATTGERAIEIARSSNPDLILMDIMLAGKLDGISTTELISEKQNIPVIYLTAYANKTFLQRAKLTSPFGYIIKPFNDNELNVTIEMALYKHALDRKLKESEERFRAIVEQSTEVVYITDSKGAITYISPVAGSIFGFAPEEMVHRHISEFLDAGECEKVMSVFRTAIEQGTGVKNFEMRMRRKDGSIFSAELNGACFKTGSFSGTAGVIHDITERKWTEEALRQSNKQLNLLSSITRHDVLNQLMVLKGYIELSRGYLGDNETLSDFLAKEEKAVTTIEEQITFTKDYQDLGATAPEWQNVNACIKKVVAGLPIGISVSSLIPRILKCLPIRFSRRSSTI